MDCRHQACLSFNISESLLKLTSIVSVMPSNRLIPCCSLLLLPSIFPTIRVNTQLLKRCSWEIRDAQTELCLLPGHIDVVPLVVINREVWKFQACWSRAQIPEERHFPSPHLHCQEISLECGAWAGVSPQARLWAWPLTYFKGGVLTAFSLFLKSKNTNTKTDLLLSLNIVFKCSPPLELEHDPKDCIGDRSTIGHQCPPPFPGLALHGASHEVLQENSLGSAASTGVIWKGLHLSVCPAWKGNAGMWIVQQGRCPETLQHGLTCALHLVS